MVLCWSGHAGHPLLLEMVLAGTDRGSAPMERQVCDVS